MFLNFPTGDFLQYQFSIDFRNPRPENIKNKRKRRYCSNLQLTVQYIGRLFLITLTYILSDSAVWSKTATPATFEVLHITSYLSLIIYVVNFANEKERECGMCSLFFRSIDVHILQFIVLMFTYILFHNMQCNFREQKERAVVGSI